MQNSRASGILLHPTSLPGRFGIGDLGHESYEFVDFLQETKQKLWHVLPLGPTGPQNSPYQCRSAFAGNPLLISPDILVEAGYLQKRDLLPIPKFSDTQIHFPAVRSYKFRLFRRAFEGFKQTRSYFAFERKQSYWLEPFAHYMALRTANHGVPWTKFDPDVRARAQEILFYKFLQYEFFRQWHQLKARCVKRNVSIMGDMPFYIEHDSADVWHFPKLFDLDKHGNARSVGGVPPDYFAKDGQLWGNPTYRWDNMEETKYAWWIERFKAVFEIVDLLRLDHFRGFEKFWKVPASESTARRGVWARGPGIKLFQAVTKQLGNLSFIAENLGVITPEVEELRHRLGLPGMAVLQFAFGDDGTHRPNNYIRELAAFTGTHDNDTTHGWWKGLHRNARKTGSSQASRELARAKAYLQTAYQQTDGQEISWSSIQAVITSVANISMIPMQDILGLSSAARMNVPGRAEGNWRWRYSPKAITPALVERLRSITVASDR
jgi:4-alpha-glucanotransferase